VTTPDAPDSPVVTLTRLPEPCPWCAPDDPDGCRAPGPLVADLVAARFDHGHGYRSRSDWGDGGLLSDLAEGDLVYIAADAPAFAAGRIPSQHATTPGRCQRDLYRVVSTMSIGPGPQWNYRVSPVLPDGTTDWASRSDRLQVIPGSCDYTAGWQLVARADGTQIED
jgi:hypothetical protein